MGKRRNNRFSSTEDERTLSNFITMMRGHKKKVTTLAAIPLWVRMRKYMYWILAYRWLSAFVISTEFVPDEAWQSTEVAYYYTWGRGHLTWEWLVGLRSHLYPFTISIIFHVLKALGVDTPYTILLAPRLFQTTMTAFGDFAFFLYVTDRFGVGSGRWSLGLMLINWFTTYCGPRTITNTTEMTLNCFALYLLQTEQVVWMVGVVAINFVIRPTAIVIWIPQLWDIGRLFFPIKVPHRLPASIFLGLVVIVFGALMDSLVAGKPVLAWLRFLDFNFVQGASAQFGEHHVLWYFYSGVPSIFGLCVIPLIPSLSLRAHRKDWYTILGFISCFSLIKHKEIRFLLPILPHMFAVTGDVLYKFSELGKDKGVSVVDKVDIGRVLINFSILSLVSNVLTSLYLCSFHQGGILPITRYVNNHSREISNPHIWVMMQCYSVPVFTYMHNPFASFEYMTCAPPNLDLDYSLFPNYGVYSNITANNATTTSVLSDWVGLKLGPPLLQPLPDFILAFDALAFKLLDVMEKHGGSYKICESRLHAQFGEDRGTSHVICRVHVKK